MNIYILSLLLEESNAIAVRYIVFIKKKNNLEFFFKNLQFICRGRKYIVYKFFFFNFILFLNFT